MPFIPSDGTGAEIGELIREKATALTDKEHPADYASAIMDLGAVVCTPKNPQCLICPWRDYCQSKGSGNPEDIPVRLKAEKKAKQGFVYLLYNHKGEIFVRKRTEKGLLSGLYEFPWGENEISFGSADVYDSGCEVTHVFTHFKLTLRIFTGKTEEARFDGKFVAPERLFGISDVDFDEKSLGRGRKKEKLTFLSIRLT